MLNLPPDMNVMALGTLDKNSLHGRISRGHVGILRFRLALFRYNVGKYGAYAWSYTI